MLISDLPPQIPAEDARIWCSVEAARRYALPPELVYAVSRTEGGRPGIAVENSNGTYDLGWMQFNTAYLATLRGFGIRPSDVQGSSCYPFHLAAWRIRGHLEESPMKGDVFTRAAWYHSRTPEYNIAYRRRLIGNARRFDYAKAARFEARMRGREAFRPAPQGSAPALEIKCGPQGCPREEKVWTWISAK